MQIISAMTKSDVLSRPERPVVPALPRVTPGLPRAVIRVKVAPNNCQTISAASMPKSRPDRRSKEKPQLQGEPAVDAITIAWTSSVVCVLTANAVLILARLYLINHPESKTGALFSAIMLLSASLLGLISLALLPIVWRTSRLKPPLGFSVFAALISLAPIIATVVLLTR
jgi:hypothetical protein